MLKLFIADLKLSFRNKQFLFWSIFFPLIFICVFGLFFGDQDMGLGTVVLVNKADSELAQTLDKTLKELDVFKLEEKDDLDIAKEQLTKGQITSIIYLPEDFGKQGIEITMVTNPANVQSNSIIRSILDNFLNQASFSAQQAKPLFTIKEDSVAKKELTYFDFVLVGIIGMAVMNSAVMGVAIGMSKYRSNKILKRLVTTPIKTWKFIIADVAARVVLNIIQISIILAVGIGVFHGHIIGNFFLLYVFAITGAILFQLVGFVVASFSKTEDAAQGLAQVVTIPMMFLSGVFFPIDQLPQWVYAIVKYLPLAPLLRLLRNVALDEISPLQDPSNIIIVLVWIFGLLTIASYKFKLTEE